MNRFTRANMISNLNSEDTGRALIACNAVHKLRNLVKDEDLSFWALVGGNTETGVEVGNLIHEV